MDCMHEFLLMSCSGRRARTDDLGVWCLLCALSAALLEPFERFEKLGVHTIAHLSSCMLTRETAD